MTVAAVAVEGLVKDYAGRAVLDGVSFEVAPGEVFALLGPNGAGKTTTAEIVEGYRAPDAGTARVLGTDPRRGGRAHRARVGIQLQAGGIDPRMRAIEVLELHGRFHVDPLPAPDLLDRLGLAAAARTRYRQLSGGERQRLGLALALVGRPELVVLDEPTSGLDVEARILVRGLLDELRAAGTTVLLTSHDLAGVERDADRLAILDRGRIVAAGSPAELATAGRPILRFRLPQALEAVDLADLARHVGGIVHEHRGHYRVEGSPVTPALVATIAGWCGERGVQVVELQAGAATLEERYLEILAAAEGRPGAGLAAEALR